MKLCVIGNSHAAALRSALAVDDSAAGAHIDFFVMPGGTGPHLHAEANRLFPAPSKKDKTFTTIPGAASDGLDLANVDAVLISAAGLPSHRNGDPGHILNQLALASLVQNQTTTRQPVSEAVMASAMESALNTSPNFEAIRLVRSVFAGRLIIQVCPLPTRAIAAYKVEGERGSDLAAQYGDRVWQFLHWYYRQQVSIIRACAETLGAHIITPDDSFFEAGQTPSKYGTPDPWHMNTAYGRLVLKQALALTFSA